MVFGVHQYYKPETFLSFTLKCGNSVVRIPYPDLHLYTNTNIDADRAGANDLLIARTRVVAKRPLAQTEQRATTSAV